MLNKVIWFCLNNKLLVAVFVLVVIGAGVAFAPFNWELEGLPREPVPVDAIPDIGENQQIVFTEWAGRSPQDIEDQITYPLTVSLLGVPGVKTIRSYSRFGFSSIYIIFEGDIDFYWSRSRVLEKLNSLSEGTLPQDVQPSLGPDATALGQIFWYTLEGRDKEGNPTGGWDLDELRSIQDWTVRYALMSAEGVSEVASVGGHVREYQIDADPAAMRANSVKLEDIFCAVKNSNIDVGAQTIEINKAEYVIRGLGFIESLSDIEKTVVKVTDNVPIRVKEVANVTYGPALRRGALDKGGAEAVGGVVVVRYGYNPLEAIKNVKEKIAEISEGLPKKTLDDGTVSQVEIVPFYDRTGLIHETLGTLNRALTQQILVTVIVVMILVLHLGSSLLISALLPLAVLMTFIAMKFFGVDANIVSLSGIAIAIGTMVDMGIIISENILKHLEEAGEEENRLDVIYRATSEVGSAVLTAVATTVVGFLPVFTMVGAEGKLFQPLAFTKTFALIGSIIVALMVIPAASHIFFTRTFRKKVKRSYILGTALILCGIAGFWFVWWAGALISVIGIYHILKENLPVSITRFSTVIGSFAVAALVTVLLASHWIPLGPAKGLMRNLIFVAVLIGGLLAFFILFQKVYSRILRWCLAHKTPFLSLVLIIVLMGGVIWIGFDTLLKFVPEQVKQTPVYRKVADTFPGLGKEFMPPLDEGSFLYMPTTMSHASIGEALDVVSKQDARISSIPEVKTAVGKIGRVDSPLDPAPVSMIETVISYKSEFVTDENGKAELFKYNEEKEEFVRDENGELIPDPDGEPYRQWREHIQSPDDIWDEIVDAAQIPGTTSAPKLQPIKARLVMLQSGMRAPMGVKVKGPDLETIEKVGLQIEKILKDVESVQPSAVIADRIVGKPYLEIDIDRDEIARYGITIKKVQDVIEVAIGGRKLTTTVEGRERYPVRVRYKRELRDSIETIEDVLVSAADGTQIPLKQLADIEYLRGPQVIKSEDTFLVGYVVFDKKEGYAEVEVVEDCKQELEEKIASGELEIPAGVSYTFSGSYENQIRAQKTLTIVVPIALLIIFLILYFQFGSVTTTLLVFSGIVVAWSGGFLMIWLYGQGWFLNFEVFGTNLRQLFQVHPINLSVAIWVGFLALFGIASDNGVVICTYIDQIFRKESPTSREEIREKVTQAGQRRIRPALMTTATTILALIPVLTSTGRGSDIMVPMAIPTFGGMVIQIVTVLVVPVLYSSVKEWKLKLAK
jgi:Cu(I)/Ag(I) efflux system membrane protein CusA/SilA